MRMNGLIGQSTWTDPKGAGSNPATFKVFMFSEKQQLIIVYIINYRVSTINYLSVAILIKMRR